MHSLWGCLSLTMSQAVQLQVISHMGGKCCRRWTCHTYVDWAERAPGILSELSGPGFQASLHSLLRCWRWLCQLLLLLRLSFLQLYMAAKRYSQASTCQPRDTVRPPHERIFFLLASLQKSSCVRYCCRQGETLCGHHPSIPRCRSPAPGL